MKIPEKIQKLSLFPINLIFLALMEQPGNMLCIFKYVSSEHWPYANGQLIDHPRLTAAVPYSWMILCQSLNIISGQENPLQSA